MTGNLEEAESELELGLATELETLIDRHSLGEVLATIASVCYRKSQRIFAQRFGYASAVKWQIFGQWVDRLATTIQARNR